MKFRNTAISLGECQIAIEVTASPADERKARFVRNFMLSDLFKEPDGITPIVFEEVKED